MNLIPHYDDIQSIIFIGLEECEIAVDGNIAAIPRLIVDYPHGKDKDIPVNDLRKVINNLPRI